MMSVQSISRVPATAPGAAHRGPVTARTQLLEAAACRHVDPELFFGGRTEDADARNEAAKRVCRCCPVREACLRRAMVHEEAAGVWGGLTPAERRTFGERIRDLVDLGEGLARRGDLDLMNLARTVRAARPGVVLLLLDRGWTERQLAAALELEPTAVRNARVSAERVVGHCRAVGIDTPSWARFILPTGGR
ncbi:WhiB family transcriptional regulator [Kitasatospora sp. NPDC094015]|uniref:WhiB family transcriptional regulator n=1 Tax=Kitasatospora sp. NPDC094015 TaxID=3155205 RepID=UPI0033180559